MRLEVNQQRAVAALLAPQGNVVNAKYARPSLALGVDERMQDPQERVWTDGNTGLARESGTAFATRLQGERGE